MDEDIIELAVLERTPHQSVPRDMIINGEPCVVRVAVKGTSTLALSKAQEILNLIETTLGGPV